MIRLLPVLALLVSLLPVEALATTSDEDLRRLLQTPGVHVIMRHALAPGNGDPSNFQVDDCSTQRNLNDRGRAQARATGEKLRALGADFDQVRTSQWCRCKDTAQLLGLGDPVEDPVLNSFYEDRSTADAQTRALAEYLRGLPKDQRTMFVTHQVNITGLTGKGVSSGELFLISVSPEGHIDVVGTMVLRP